MVSHCYLYQCVIVPGASIALIWFQTHSIPSNPGASVFSFIIFYYFYYFVLLRAVRHLICSVSLSVTRSLMVHVCCGNWLYCQQKHTYYGCFTSWISADLSTSSVHVHGNHSTVPVQLNSQHVLQLASGSVPCCPTVFTWPNCAPFPTKLHNTQ